jgi:hypothetical protein
VFKEGDRESWRARLGRKAAKIAAGRRAAKLDHAVALRDAGRGVKLLEGRGKAVQWVKGPGLVHGTEEGERAQDGQSRGTARERRCRRTTGMTGGVRRLAERGHAQSAGGVAPTCGPCRSATEGADAVRAEHAG